MGVSNLWNDVLECGVKNGACMPLYFLIATVLIVLSILLSFSILINIVPDTFQLQSADTLLLAIGVVTSMIPNFKR